LGMSHQTVPLVGSLPYLVLASSAKYA